MESKQILSSTLPNIPGVAKDLVNYGKWFLYEISWERNHDVIYLLSTNNSNFFLSSAGDIICQMPQGATVEYISQVTFSDILKPQTPNYFAL